jgi:hypothetical protein
VEAASASVNIQTMSDLIKYLNKSFISVFSPPVADTI